MGCGRNGTCQGGIAAASRYQDFAAPKACWQITPIPQSLLWLQKSLPSNSWVSVLTFKMLGGSGWLQSSSLITFQRVACHELINSLIQCGQIARVIFCPQTLAFWTSSLSETYPRRASNKKDFFQFSGLAMTSLCFLSGDQKFNGKKKKKKSICPKIRFAGNAKKQ